MAGKGAKAARWARIIVSAVCTAVLTGALTALGQRLEPLASWLERVQFMPAAATFAVAVFAGWVGATLIFGRVYCSSVCPMGFYLDVVGRIGREARRRPYRWAPPLNALRYGVLVIAVAALAFGLTAAANALDPYEQWCMICDRLFKPLWAWTVNFWAYPPVKLASASLAGYIAAVVVALLAGGIAAAKGRLWCNTLCPVGATLGLVARYSLFHFDINTDTCTNCRRCEYACKAQCINLADHVVDMSRCVVCFDCTASCPHGSIRYTLASHTLSLPMMQRAQGGRRVATGLTYSGPDAATKPANPTPSDEAIS